ncbi:MAG: hypothetical protein ACR2G6_15945 [Gemmatimonadaceae bacterium]
MLHRVWRNLLPDPVEPDRDMRLEVNVVQLRAQPVEFIPRVGVEEKAKRERTASDALEQRPVTVTFGTEDSEHALDRDRGGFVRRARRALDPAVRCGHGYKPRCAVLPAIDHSGDPHDYPFSVTVLSPRFDVGGIVANHFVSFCSISGEQHFRAVRLPKITC